MPFTKETDDNQYKLQGCAQLQSWFGFLCLQGDGMTFSRSCVLKVQHLVQVPGAKRSVDSRIPGVRASCRFAFNCLQGQVFLAVSLTSQKGLPQMSTSI